MVVFPNAKINLGLEILRKRPDGFHDIDSVFYPVPLCDALEVVELSDARRDRWNYSGLNIPGSEAENLCAIAMNLLRERKEIPSLDIFLHKAIPMGAGLGGGSADGSFFLKCIDELFQLGLGQDELKGMALKLGSDCPFFIDNLPARAQGRGEALTPIDVDLMGKHLMLVCPDIHVSTKEAYGIIRPDDSQESPTEIVTKPVDQWRGQLRNRFEEFAFEQDPKLAEVKRDLYEEGALYASMSGSGSAIYGIFDEETDESRFSIYGPVFTFAL